QASRGVAPRLRQLSNNLSDRSGLMKKMRRRDFLRAGAAGVAVASARTLSAGAPAVLIQNVKPAVVASANGNQFKNGGDETFVQRAFRLMTTGADVLDA